MWETASIPPNAKLIVGMMIFTCSSICMSVGNKRAVMLFPYHNLLIVFQNLVSIIATMMFMRSHVSLPNPKWLVYWIPTAVLFSLVLLSSVKAMSALNLTSVMIFRNITPIPSTLVEYLIFNTRVSLRSVLALCGVLVGVLAYAWDTARFSPTGVAWVCVNVVCMVSELLYNRFLLAHRSDVKASLVSMSLIKTLMSTPILLTIAAASGELFRFFKTESAVLPTEDHAIPLTAWAWIVATGAVSLALGVSGWFLQSQLSTVTFMVLGNMNKLGIVAVSLVWLGEMFDSGVMTFGCFFALGCSLWYGYERQRSSAAASSAAAGCGGGGGVTSGGGGGGVGASAAPMTLAGSGKDVGDPPVVVGGGGAGASAVYSHTSTPNPRSVSPSRSAGGTGVGVALTQRSSPSIHSHRERDASRRQSRRDDSREPLVSGGNGGSGVKNTSFSSFALQGTHSGAGSTGGGGGIYHHSGGGGGLGTLSSAYGHHRPPSDGGARGMNAFGGSGGCTPRGTGGGSSFGSARQGFPQPVAEV